MKERSAVFAFCLALFAAAFVAPATPADNPPAAPIPAPGAALLQVNVTYQEYDVFAPWQKRRPGVRVGYGVLIGDGLVLTTENLVRNHTLVELNRATRGEKIPATVLMSDCQMDLALLRVGDPAAIADMTTLTIVTNDVTRRAKVEIVQFDETRQIQRSGAEVVQINMAELPSAPYASLSFNLLTDQNVNREGAAVVTNNALCGLIMGYSRGERIGYMLPASVLRWFIDDVAHAPYQGVAAAGFKWTALVDPAKRAYLGVPRQELGILVLATVAGSGAAEVLKPNDVILEWDGRPVDNLGFYEDPVYGHMSVSYLVRGNHRPGDSVPVTIFRNRHEQKVNIRLSNPDDTAALIPENVTGERAEYLVTGGIILRGLDGSYLKAHGSDWQSKTDIRLANLYLTRRDAPEQPGDRVVILGGVLPDPINIGYQEFRDDVVTKVNGKPIRNMDDVFRVLDGDGTIDRITLQSIGIDLVLDRNELAVANQRLAQLYRLPALQYRRSADGDTR